MPNYIKYKIGATIISKNNSATIEDTLKSIHEICSQIVLIDTGSTDNTIEKALKFGVENHYMLWNNSFADARNYALNFMRTDWILIIDTDEVLNKFDIDEFNNITQNTDCGGIRVKIDNLLENNAVSTHTYTRIIKNDKNIRFVGNIHEQINESIDNLNLKIYDSNITILHYGYREVNQEKIERNKKLLEEQVKQSNDDWSKYHLANTEFSAKNLDTAEQIYLEIIDSPELTNLQKENVKIKLSQIALSKDDFYSMDKYLNFVSDDINNEGFRNYLLLVKSLSEKNIKEAKILLQNDSISKSNLVDKVQLEQLKEIVQKF